MAVKNRLRWTRAIGVIEFCGSLYGVILVTYFSYPHILTSLFSWQTLMLLPHSVGLFAGYKLMTDQLIGFQLSKGLQAFQIIKISGSIVSWELYLGAKIILGYFGDTIGFEAEAGANWTWVLNSNDASLGFGVNALALASLIFLLSTPKELFAKVDSDQSPISVEQI